MGEWLQENGDAVYGTRPGPLQGLEWCRSTVHPGKFYLHVFDWFRRDEIVVPGLEREVVRTRLLADSKTTLSIHQAVDGMVIQEPATPPDTMNTVIVLDTA